MHFEFDLFLSNAAIYLEFEIILLRLWFRNQSCEIPSDHSWVVRRPLGVSPPQHDLLFLLKKKKELTSPVLSLIKTNSWTGILNICILTKKELWFELNWFIDTLPFVHQKVSDRRRTNNEEKERKTPHSFSFSFCQVKSQLSSTQIQNFDHVI